MRVHHDVIGDKTPPPCRVGERLFAPEGEVVAPVPEHYAFWHRLVEHF